MHRRMKTDAITAAVCPCARRYCAYTILIIHLIATCSAELYPGDKCIDSRELPGICSALDHCPSALEDLRRGMKPTHCGFDRNEPIVCCPTANSLLTFSTSQPFSSVASLSARNPGEIARARCEEYSKLCPELFAIDGGTPALPSEFPHMVAVGYGAKSNIHWKCGGSLISENFILTAAHCLHGGKDGPPHWVLLGTLTLVKNETFLGEAGQIHEIIRRIHHPEYKPPAKYNDVALLEIGPAITKNAKSLLSKELHPACLATENSYQWRSFVATGWGRVGFGGEPSNELLKVELDVFDEAKCNETFEIEIRTTNQLKRGIDSTMLCAGILSGGKDTCQGDSGGPLQFEVKTECQYEIWGIISFGKVCSFANSPSVYMRVSAYVPWIEDIVWPT